MFYRNIYFSSKTGLCSISSLERVTKYVIWQDSPPWNTATAKQMSKIDPYLVKSILESLLCSGRERNLFWISEVLLVTEVMASLCYSYFTGHCGFGMSQPETESTQTWVHACSSSPSRRLHLEHKNRHRDKFLLRRRPGQSSACLATRQCPGMSLLPRGGSDNILADVCIDLSKYKIQNVPATFIILILLK